MRKFGLGKKQVPSAEAAAAHAAGRPAQPSEEITPPPATAAGAQMETDELTQELIKSVVKMVCNRLQKPVPTPFEPKFCTIRRADTDKEKGLVHVLSQGQTILDFTVKDLKDITAGLSGPEVKLADRLGLYA